MAKMLARTNRHLNNQRHRPGWCRCDKSALFFTPSGRQRIRKANRAREARTWRTQAAD